MLTRKRDKFRNFRKRKYLIIITIDIEDYDQEGKNIDLAKILIDNEKISRSISHNSQSSLSSNSNQLNLAKFNLNLLDLNL